MAPADAAPVAVVNYAIGRIPDQDVVAGTAVQTVGTGAADQDIVAGPAAQRVAGAAADKAVGSGTAGETMRAKPITYKMLISSETVGLAFYVFLPS